VRKENNSIGENQSETENGEKESGRGGLDWTSRIDLPPV